MGHTVASQKQVVDTILSELRDYRRSLREEDKPAFDSVMAKIMLHLSSISFTCSYNVWVFVLISVVLEQEKELMKNESLTYRHIQE